MAEIKTTANKNSVPKFIAAIKDPQMKKDCKTLVKIMQEITKSKPGMWGTSIVGFDARMIQYSDGHELAWPSVGFSPRKSNLTLYIMMGFEKEKALMKKLGKYKTGKSCLYIKNLESIDLAVLKTLIKKNVVAYRKKYPKVA